MILARDEDGSILIELAIVLPVYVLILVGLANYAFWINESIQLQEAANAGAAYATIPGNSTDTDGMKKAAVASLPDFNVSINVNAVDVYSCTPGGAIVGASTTCPGGGGPLLFAQVTTTANEDSVLRFTGTPTKLALRGFASFEVVP